MAIIAAFFVLLWEPQPYKYIELRAFDAYQGDDILHVEIDIHRTQSCPYMIERTIFDSKNIKLFDSREVFSEPQVVGAPETFGAPVRMRGPVPNLGRAVYSVRIGTMCNFVQRAFPNWGEWYRVPFQVFPPIEKSSRPSG